MTSKTNEKYRLKEKEITKESMCSVEFYENVGNYGAEGGYSETHIKVTDKTSKMAYETLTALVSQLRAGPPQEEGDIPVNKRASRAVDIS